MKKIVTIQGTGRVQIMPDTVCVNFGLVTPHSDYQEAVNQAAQKVEKLTAVTIDQQFSAEDLQTQSFSVDIKEKNEFKEEVWQTEQIGYEVNHTLRLTFSYDRERLVSLLTAVSETLQLSVSIYFTVQDHESLQQQLLINATKDARFQAEVLVKASSLTLGELIRIESIPSETSWVSPVTFQAEAKFFKQSASVPMIHPAMIEERISVTFVWQIINKGEEAL